MSGMEIRLENVLFRYGETQMRFDVSVAAGALVAVMGPSGAGKTTLLNLIAGFERPESGRVLIGGRDMTDVPPAARPVSMIFQENNLFAHLDVETNVGLGLEPSGRLSAAQRRRVAEALASTGLSGLNRRRPGELSGGQRQRVAIARALLRDRPVMLLDEPFAALGPALRAEMLELIAGIHRERGFTVVMVTHRPQDARAIAETALFISAGRVLASAPVGELFAGAAGLPELAAYLGETGRDKRPNPNAESGRKN